MASERIAQGVGVYKGDRIVTAWLPDDNGTHIPFPLDPDALDNDALREAILSWFQEPVGSKPEWIDDYFLGRMRLALAAYAAAVAGRGK